MAATREESIAKKSSVKLQQRLQAEVKAYNQAMSAAIAEGVQRQGAEQKEEPHPKNCAEAITLKFGLFESTRRSKLYTKTVAQQFANIYEVNPKSKLFALPANLIQKILDDPLTAQDHTKLARLCKDSYFLFQPPLREMRLQQLLQHVIYGNLAAAEKIIQSCPRLLLLRGTVTDYSGRAIEGTALQLALGALSGHMLDMIYNHLLNLAGEWEIINQSREQFPEGWEQKKAAQAKNDLLALQKVIKAIQDATPENNSYEACERACEPALVEFRLYLEAQAKASVIKSGIHFNMQLLIKAFELYRANYDIFGEGYAEKLNAPKNLICWRKVVGFIQRYLPAEHARMFCHPEALSNPLEYGDKIGYFFYPLACGSSGIGYDFARWIDGGASMPEGSIDYWAVYGLIKLVDYFMVTILPRYVGKIDTNPSNQSGCAIM